MSAMLTGYTTALGISAVYEWTVFLWGYFDVWGILLLSVEPIVSPRGRR
jgi:hypothetical protein